MEWKKRTLKDGTILVGKYGGQFEISESRGVPRLKGFNYEVYIAGTKDFQKKYGNTKSFKTKEQAKKYVTRITGKKL